jgi:hypothetical protein
MCSFFYWKICGSENLDDFACIIYGSSFHSTIHFLVLPKLFSEFLVHVFTKLLLFCSNCSLNFLALLNWCCLLELSQVVVCGLPDCAVEAGAPRRNGRAAGPDACASPAVAWVADDGEFFRCASRRAAAASSPLPLERGGGRSMATSAYRHSRAPSSPFPAAAPAVGRALIDVCGVQRRQPLLRSMEAEGFHHTNVQYSGRNRLICWLPSEYT